MLAVREPVRLGAHAGRVIPLAAIDCLHKVRLVSIFARLVPLMMHVLHPGVQGLNAIESFMAA